LHFENEYFMEYLSLFVLIFITHLLAVMSPGPDFVMVLKNALQYNRKIAVYTALGISLGIGVHILYSIWGIAYLLQQNHALFTGIKIAGALYLIYMGIRTWQSARENIEVKAMHTPANISIFEAIKIGFVTNVLNPKASLFFLSIFSVVIPPDVPLWVLLIISAMLIVVTFLWFAFVSYLFTNPQVVKRYQKIEKYLLLILGLILILLGAGIILEILAG